LHGRTAAVHGPLDRISCSSRRWREGRRHLGRQARASCVEDEQATVQSRRQIRQPGAGDVFEKKAIVAPFSYSALSDSNGLTDAARRAGRYDASIATMNK